MIKKILIFLWLVSCGDSGKKSSDDDAETPIPTTEETSSTADDDGKDDYASTKIIPEGTFRLSSSTIYSVGIGEVVLSVRGDLLHEVSYQSSMYTVEEVGFATMFNGSMEVYVGCPSSSTGYTKWEFQLDSSGTVFYAQNLQNTCYTGSNTGVDASDVSIVWVSESYKVVTDGYERTVIATVDGDRVTYKYVFQNIEAESSTPSPSSSESSEISDVDGLSDIHVYSPKDESTFLGCWSCSEYDSDSIHNDYGNYGSSYASNSIRNEYGTFGSDYSSYSACNEYASSPPEIYTDDFSNYFGVLSINEYNSDSICNDSSYFYSSEDCLLLLLYCSE